MHGGHTRDGRADREEGNDGARAAVELHVLVRGVGPPGSRLDNDPYAMHIPPHESYVLHLVIQPARGSPQNRDLLEATFRQYVLDRLLRVGPVFARVADLARPGPVW